MTRIHLVLGDQLSPSLSSLCDAAPDGSIVLMAEVMTEARYVRHHKKKIAFLFSAMRHFAEELRGRGFAVRYVTLDDPDNSQSLIGEVERALAATGAAGVVVTEPGEWRLLEEMRGWQERLGLPVEIRDDTRSSSPAPVSTAGPSGGGSSAWSISTATCAAISAC